MQRVISDGSETRRTIEYVQPETAAFGSVFICESAHEIAVEIIGKSIAFPADTQCDFIKYSDAFVDEFFFGRPKLHYTLFAVVIRNVIKIHICVGKEDERRGFGIPNVDRRFVSEIGDFLFRKNKTVPRHFADDSFRRRVPGPRFDPALREHKVARLRIALRDLHDKLLAVEHVSFGIFQRRRHRRLSRRLRNQFHAVFRRLQCYGVALCLPCNVRSISVHIGEYFRFCRDDRIQLGAFRRKGQFALVRLRTVRT